MTSVRAIMVGSVTPYLSGILGSAGAIIELASGGTKVYNPTCVSSDKTFTQELDQKDIQFLYISISASTTNSVG